MVSPMRHLALSTGLVSMASRFTVNQAINVVDDNTIISPRSESLFYRGWAMSDSMFRLSMTFRKAVTMNCFSSGPPIAFRSTAERACHENFGFMAGISDCKQNRATVNFWGKCRQFSLQFEANTLASRACFSLFRRSTIETS